MTSFSISRLKFEEIWPSAKSEFYITFKNIIENEEFFPLVKLEFSISLEIRPLRWMSALLSNYCASREPVQTNFRQYYFYFLPHQAQICSPRLLECFRRTLV